MRRNPNGPRNAGGPRNPKGPRNHGSPRNPNGSRNPRKPQELYSVSMIQSAYGIGRSVIERCFPPPAVSHPSCKGGKIVRLWTRSQVEQGLSHPQVVAALERSEKKSARQLAEQLQIREYLLTFDIEKLRLRAMEMSRRFVLHIGPTNSGKTYQSIQALEQAESGVYLGPLRLLALEMYDTLNRDGTPCNLLTGEESLREESARHTASTIELANYSAHYAVAVIDEAQMITDPFRGDRWFRAIYCLDADEIHICLAPEARSLIIGILESFNAPYTVVEHERLAPLSYAGVFRNITDAQPGDALIVFSRRAVLAVSAELEQNNIHASVIYGALPPVSRREEVRRFAHGETSVVVATDAIGMGISLPIRRIIFCETSKFDGRDRRGLLSGEIKQIAGRAGRFGIYPEGFVLTMAEEWRIRDGITCEEKQKKKLTIPFPEETLASPWPLDKLMLEWNRLPRSDVFVRADMSDPLFLYTHLKPYAKSADRKLLFRLITCPVDVKDEGLVFYWLSCCRCILANKPLPEPPSGTGTLEECETRYRELDIRHQLLRQIGIEEDRMDEKLELCRAINKFLKENKDEYLRRCRQCGRKLPATHPYGVCDRCFRESSDLASVYRRRGHSRR